MSDKRKVRNLKDVNQDSASWAVRPYHEGDESKAVALFNKVFGKNLSEEKYRWKLFNSFWPKGTIPTWYADANGLIVGQYTGTAMRFWIQNQEATIVHSCDAMTDPDFRKQGILSKLGKTAMNHWKEAGILFTFGFPNQNYGSRYAYLNWQPLYQLTWMWKPLRLDQLLERRLRLPKFLSKTAAGIWTVIDFIPTRILRTALQNIDLETIENPGPEFDVLWNELKFRYKALTVRDREWISYRYAKAPQLKYRLLLARRQNKPVGFLAYRIRTIEGARIGYIADLFTAPDDTTTRFGLLQYAQEKIYRAGAQSVMTLVPLKHPILKSFRLTGFVRRYHAFNISIITLQDKLPMEILKDPEGWFTIGGDFDFI